MFLYSSWRNLPISTRIQIAEALGIKKVGPTHVRDNYVESDGYVIGDVEAALNVDKLQAYLGTDERDLATLFKMLVDKVEGNVDTTSVDELDIPGGHEGPIVEQEKRSTIETPKKVVRKGRPKKSDGKA